jgi:riboflavin biosynthesis pyrimidine reductase
MAVHYHVTMSLDGFTAGPNGETDWAAAHEPGLESAGAVLSGPSAVPAKYRGPLFVKAGEPLEIPGVVVLTGDVHEAVATALAAAGEKHLVVTGADIARECLENRLVDDIFVHLAPVLLGDGTRFFEVPGGRRIDLERVCVTESPQVTALRYRVVK